MSKKNKGKFYPKMCEAHVRVLGLRQHIKIVGDRIYILKPKVRLKDAKGKLETDENGKAIYVPNELLAEISVEILTSVTDAVRIKFLVNNGYKKVSVENFNNV